MAKGSIGTCAEAIREEIRLVDPASRESSTAASYLDAYAVPLTEDEIQMLDAAAALAGEAFA